MKLPFIVGILLLCATVNAIPDGYLTKLTVSPENGEHIPNYLMQAYKIPLYKRCEELAITPVGVIVKMYQRGTVRNGEPCKWIIKAPEDKVVNIALLSFNLESYEKPVNASLGSTVVSFYDYSRPQAGKPLNQFFITPAENIHRFSEAIRGKEIHVVMTYHDLAEYSKQTIFVRYEFLDDDSIFNLSEDNF